MELLVKAKLGIFLVKSSKMVVAAGAFGTFNNRGYLYVLAGPDLENNISIRNRTEFINRGHLKPN